MFDSIALRWGFLALVLCTLSAAPAETAPAAPQSDLQKLQQRLDEIKAQNALLRQRNAELERHLADLGQKLKQMEGQLKQPEHIIIPPLKFVPSNPQQLNLPNGRTLPEGWGERQFNGVPYYLVPLRANGVEP